LGNKITLTASDGFKLGGYRAEPQGKPKGGLVVIQEIFGVNHHVRAMCDRFAAVGYTSTAPAVFDRIQPNFECGYTPDEIAHARTLIPKIDWAKMLLDVTAAIDNVKGAGKVGIVGYCMGGTVAFLSAGKLDGLSAAVGYYGGQIAKNVDLKPKIPTQLHFGDQDQSIPMSDVDLIKQKRSDCDIYVYQGAGHGFSCDERGSYNEAAHKQAWDRTMAWFGKYVG
jgi:carboxymethylenebutenolidase